MQQASKQRIYTNIDNNNICITLVMDLDWWNPSFKYNKLNILSQRDFWIFCTDGVNNSITLNAIVSISTPAKSAFSDANFVSPSNVELKSCT